MRLSEKGVPLSGSKTVTGPRTAVAEKSPLRSAARGSVEYRSKGLRLRVPE
jgi:hypothetical protein